MAVGFTVMGIAIGDLYATGTTVGIPGHQEAGSRLTRISAGVIRVWLGWFLFRTGCHTH